MYSSTAGLPPARAAKAEKKKQNRLSEPEPLLEKRVCSTAF
jgi:hypothetical protein